MTLGRNVDIPNLPTIGSFLDAVMVNWRSGRLSSQHSGSNTRGRLRHHDQVRVQRRVT
jgi:hypothetical protein